MIDIRPVDYHDKASFQSCVALADRAFQSGPDFNVILGHILLQPPDKSLLLGAYDGDALVGMTSFVPHRVCLDGETSLAYQACAVASDPDYRGRGIFVALVEEAKRTLLANGGAFLFGYPNAIARPIWTSKLGFNEIGLSIVYLPAVLAAYAPTSLFNMRVFCSNISENSNMIYFDAYSTSSWKSARYGKDIVSVEHLTNYMFGKVVNAGSSKLPVRIFSVGGYEVNKPLLIGHLFRQVRLKTGAEVLRFIGPPCGAVIAAARYKKRGTSTEPLIMYPLNWELKDRCIDAWAGLKDVY